MDTKELIQSIIASEEDAGDKFLESMEERISDALEVRKVELASGMMDEDIEQVDEASPTYNVTQGGRVIGTHSAAGGFRSSRPGENTSQEGAPNLKRIRGATIDHKSGPIDKIKMVSNKAKLISKMKEDFEQIDEAKYQGLSRDTLAKYNVAAARRIRSSTSLARRFDDEAATQRRRGNKEDAEANQSLSSEYQRAAKNRIRGIERATERLAREEVEQANEAQLTDMQTTRLMGLKGGDVYSTLAALRRYRKVGNINGLSPAHRALVTQYLQRQAGGLGNLSTSVQRAAYKNNSED